MGFEKRFISPEKKPDQSSPNQSSNENLAILNQQMAEAIKAEDCEQAAVLRDFIGKNNDPSLAFSKKDFIKPNLRGIYNTSQHDPKYRAWEGLNAIRQKTYWEGEERVEENDFFYNLTADNCSGGALDFDDWKKIRALKDVKGTEKVDFIINLRQQREEIKDIINLAEGKIDRLERPYRREADLAGRKQEESYSAYDNDSRSMKRIENLDKVPEDVRQPLNYWRRVYKNSLVILKELDYALEELS